MNCASLDHELLDCLSWTEVHVDDRARNTHVTQTVLRVHENCARYWFLCIKIIWNCQLYTPLRFKKKTTTTTAFLISNTMVPNLVQHLILNLSHPYRYVQVSLTDWFQPDITTLRSENEDGDVDVGTWKFAHYACAKSRETIFQGSVKRDGREKVSFDVLMKTGNILSKIMVILDIYGIKMLTTFSTEYHTIFFGFIWKIESVSSVLHVSFFYFFLHLSNVEPGWKSRIMKVFFYFVNEFLVYMFVSLYSIRFFNCFFIF